MKKSIFIAVLAVSVLTACGNKTTGAPSQNAVTTESVTSNESPAPNETKEQADTKAIVEVAEQEIFNQDGIKVTVKGFDQDATGPYLNVLVENDTDKNIIVQSRKSSLNGYMIDFTFSCNVASGKKANDKMKMDLASIELSGIGKIYDIDFDLATIAENNNIYLERNLSEPYTQNYDDSGTVIFDDKDIKIIWKDWASDDYYTAFSYYIENNSAKEITVQARDTSINGFMVDPSMSTDVLPGKKSVDVMIVYNSDLEANNITDLQEMETSFRVFAENLTEVISDTDPVMIDIKE
jgi:hypothetical protein